jgi:hypothetical protein
MIYKVNQKLISIDTDSMDSWGDLKSEELHQSSDQILALGNSVEIVGLELLLEHRHFDSGSESSISISTPVDSLDLTRERSPGIVYISPDGRPEAPGRTKKRRKPRRARRPGGGVLKDCENWEIAPGRTKERTIPRRARRFGYSTSNDCEDGEIDSLTLNRERLSSIHNVRRNRKQITTEKKTSEERQLPFKHHDRTCPNAFPDVVAMSEPNIGGVTCAA